MGDAEQVMAAAESRAAALASGDAKRLWGLLHDQFRWTSHTGETFRRREYVQRNTDGRATWRSQTLNDTEVVVVGDSAVLHAEAIDVVLSADLVPETFRMPMTQVWVREPSGWKCVAGHAGPRSS